jgi:general nucleoside transport system ATP-binding protein
MKIELDRITKHFGPVRANHNVSLTVEEGTILGLLGENGAGKTTLMNVLSGYLQPESGEIRLDGHPVTLRSPADAIRHGIGMLHQDPLDVPALSVLDNFSLGLEAGFWHRRNRVRRTFFNLCRRFGLLLQPDESVSHLSVGERQQLELIRLLALGVQTIILDEPTTGISAPQKALLFDTLRRLAEEGLTVIFVSHKLEDVESLCSKVTVLREGEVTGSLEAPFDRDRMVALMFGRAVSEPSYGSMCTTQVRLDVRDLTVVSYRLNLAPVTLQACAGEVIGLAGLEGSGQRLFMETCAGIRRADSGRLILDGVDLTAARYTDYLERGVAYVPASRMDEGLIRGLTIREHFVLVGQKKGFFVDWDAAERRAEERIRAFNLVGTTASRVEELSGGNQQRALLSLLPDGLKLLMLDHPTRGLDLGSEQWVWSQLHARCAEGTVILFASTDLDELVDNSDRIVVFSGGKASEAVASAEVTREQLGYLIGGVNL